MDEQLYQPDPGEETPAPEGILPDAVSQAEETAPPSVAGDPPVAETLPQPTAPLPSPESKAPSEPATGPPPQPSGPYGYPGHPVYNAPPYSAPPYSRPYGYPQSSYGYPYQYGYPYPYSYGYPPVRVPTPEERAAVRAEGRNLRKALNAFGLSGIAFLVVSAAVSYLTFFVVHLLAGTLGGNRFNAWYISVNLEMILTVLLALPLVFGFYAKTQKKRLTEILPLGFENKTMCFLYIFAGLLLAFVCQIVSAVIVVILEQFGLQSGGGGGVSRVHPVIQLIVVPFMVGIAEEFAFRGVALQLLRKYGDTFAILTTSFAFGALHGNLTQFVFATMLGMVMGYITVKTNSLWPAIAIHAGNNLFSTVSVLLLDRMELFLPARLFIMLLVFGVGVIAIVGLLIMAGCFGAQKLNNQGHSPRFFTGGQKFKVVLTAPLLIGLFVFMIFWGNFMELLGDWMGPVLERVTEGLPAFFSR